MSHFVSRSSKDFDALQHQLLRREPVDGEDVLEEQDDTGDQGAPEGMSSALASRRRREVSDYGLEERPPRPQSVATPSAYSRRNSPELPDAAPPRPRSVAGGAPDYSSAPSQVESNDYFSKPARSDRPSDTADVPNEPQVTSPYRVDLKSGEVRGSSPFGRSNSADHSQSPRRYNGDGYNSSTLRPRKNGKGVSFSDKTAGPGEEGHVSNAGGSHSGGRNGHQYKRPTRSNSGFGDLELDGNPAASNGHHLHRTKSLGMISPAEMAPRKLGTWDGVFMPVSLNILGIILFLRFGFILGQAGLLGAVFLLLVSYAIDTLTAMSLSAISTNGQVRGGGAYYLISRSLGPEFGGSIGLIFFAGQALNAAMNVLGFVESLTDAFGVSRGSSGFLPEGPWYFFFYGSVVLLLSTIVCLVGSKLFARATLALAFILGVAIISIPISSLTVSPFVNDDRGAYYTGWSIQTLRANLLPHFTSGAAGSSTGANKENWQSVFGVLFPAVTGILAGASMSGDLRKPSKSIPKGTNYSLLFTFLIYLLSFVVFAGTIERESFYLDVGIVSDVAMSPEIITFGALASTAFSALMGVMACGKVLQAIARDNLLPILDVFGQGTEISDTPTFAVIGTYIICQLILFVDSVNTIAQLVTMTTLLTFGTLSFATCALKAGGAPSFRPSFKYWNIWTAGGGAVSCFGAMFFTDPLAAIACIVVAIFLFVAIHFFSPPKPWGDVTRNLTYHFVRKYLLRLDERKGHVKYWRPQILLLANNPRTEWNLIIFCNSLKKGALYVLGHVLKGEFSECLGELRKQQIAWLKLVDLTGIKSFVDVVIANDEREGARNLILSCGLGGMRPNIVVMGFPREMQRPAKAVRPNGGRRSDGSEITIRGVSWPYDGHQVIDIGSLPTDTARKETPIKATAYVGIMEESLALNKALAIAYNFDSMKLLGPHAAAVAAASAGSDNKAENSRDQFIDLWPIQIASADQDESHAWDTYTMVLQLGTILSMTGTWKSHRLRVSVFVEHEHEVEDERKRIRSLLDNLRIPAMLRVFSLSHSSVSTYQSIVLGKRSVGDEVEDALRGDPWWEALKQLRREEERRIKAAAKRRSQPAAQAIPSTPTAGTGTSGKQSKKEQRLLGVSLPAEHLAFHKQNIRIGLAHPRARRLDAESDGEESDFSDDSEEDELALLSDDDDWFVEARAGRGLGLRRSSTVNASLSSSRASSASRRPRAYSIGGSAGLPDDPITRPLISPAVAGGAAGASVASSYGSLSSSQRTATPATVKGAMPTCSSNLSSSYVSTDSSETPRGSLLQNVSGFSKVGGAADTDESDLDGTLKASDREQARRQLLEHMQQQQDAESSSRELQVPSGQRSLRRQSSNLSVSSNASSRSGHSSSGGTSDSGSWASNSRAQQRQQQSGASSRRTKSRRGSRSSLHGRTRSEEAAGSSLYGGATRRPKLSRAPSSNASSVNGGASSPRVASGAYAINGPLISFNELPNRAQYLILK